MLKLFMSTLSHNYTEYSYPHVDMETEEERVEKEYKEKRTKHLQKIAGQVKVATPNNYDDLDLYVKMTQHYYVCNFTSYQPHNLKCFNRMLTIQVCQLKKSQELKY